MKQTILSLFYKVRCIKGSMQTTSLSCRKSSRHRRVNERYFKVCSYHFACKNNFLAKINTKYKYIFFFLMANTRIHIIRRHFRGEETRHYYAFFAHYHRYNRRFARRWIVLTVHRISCERKSGTGRRPG